MLRDVEHYANYLSSCEIIPLSVKSVLRPKNELAITTLDDTLAVWLSGSALASINVVALRQTRLVLGWVTVCGRVNHLGT